MSFDPFDLFGTGGLFPKIPLPLDDDECVVNRAGVCARGDERHHYDMQEVVTLDGRSRWVRGRCLHRHTTPVDLALTGEVVGRLCLHCRKAVGGQVEPPGAVQPPMRED